MPADAPTTTPDTDSYDLVVVGAGTGGYSAAFRAAQLGLRVALIDQHKIGGTCLHRGCIPTKAMLESADLLDKIRKADQYGLIVAEAHGDPVAIAARRAQVVERLHKGLLSLVRKNKVDYIRGTAKLEGADHHPGRDHRCRRPADRRAGAHQQGHHPRDRLTREEPAGPRAGRRPHRDQRRHPAVG